MVNNRDMVNVNFRKFSFYSLFIQLCIFLLFAGFVKNIVDFIMLHLCPQRERSIYSKIKIINSADFSDLKEGLDPVKKEREDQTQKN